MINFSTGRAYCDASDCTAAIVGGKRTTILQGAKELKWKIIPGVFWCYCPTHKTKAPSKPRWQISRR